MRSLLLFSLLWIVTAVQAQEKFQHTSTAANINSNSTFIDNKAINGNPHAVIIVEADPSAKNKALPAIGVWYTGNQWAIFNQDRTPMQPGLVFTIIYKEPGDHAFYKSATGGLLLLDHPSLNNDPSASFFISQVWNPGGNGGIYNNAEPVIVYEKKQGRWTVVNTNQSPVPEGASFNILITKAEPAPPNTKIPVTGKTPIISNNTNPVINNPAITNIPDPSLLQPINTASANLGFEDPFINWTATGTAFDHQPISGNTVTSERMFPLMNYSSGGIGGDYWKGMAYPIGHKGNNWIGTYEDGRGDAPIGTLTSRPLRAEKRYLSFLLSGGKDLNRLYIELQVKKTDYEAAWGSGKKGFFGDTEDGFTRVNRITPLLNSEELFRYYFDLDAELNHQYPGKAIRIRIVDDKTTGWGHINADDFVFKDDLLDFLSISRDGFRLYADKDKPVWGFADTHAHWVNHVGLSGLMHGTPGGKVETSDVRRNIPACDGFNHGLPSITPGLLIAQTEQAAMNRFPERLADPGNAACMTLSGIVAIPTSGVAAGISALFGSLGQWGTGAHAGTGALDGAITGALIGMIANPPFQACGYQFTKDVFAKHYGNYTPDNNTAVNNYVDFPRWNSFFHQMMHISWVRRSYDGGQRLMVVPVGVAKSWEFNTTSNGVMADPKRHIENAVDELKRIVAQNPEWMAIAYTPQQAREIILSNKMVIVVALEQAEVGSYFSSVKEEIDWLERLGIRHVFPIHNINNSLGGAAVFNSALNSYNDLVIRAVPDDPIQALGVREGNSNDDTKTTVKLKRRFMRQGMRTMPIIGFGTLPFFYSNDVPDYLRYDDFTAHKNSRGLTTKGEQYVHTLMKKGMIIDVDHMSDLAQDRAMQLLRSFNYPMISGHTNFRELRREDTETGGGDKEARLKTEFTIFDSRAREINDAGGMFGLMTQQNNIRNADGCPVPNNSAGGSSSFAQAYWYTFQKTRGEKGIAFGSDFNGFAPQIAPRFGVDAAFMLEGDDVLNVTTGDRGEDKLRRTQAFQQTQGVKYDNGVKTYHYHRFLKPSFLTSEEREIWEAIAIAKSGTVPSSAWQPGGGLSVERTGLQQDKVHNMANGFRWGILREPTGDYGDYLECPGYISRIESLNNCMPERKAAYLCVRGLGSLPERMKTPRTMELYQVMSPVYNLWMQFENGPNEPLRRSFAYAGGRDFDFNLDGLAHYGMFPDLVQDLKNQGLNAEHLRPLFLATEQYIRMWEQADAAKKNVKD